MPIIFTARYGSGGAEPSRAPSDEDTRHEIVWIDVVDPTEREIEDLTECFGLHPLAVKDALTPQITKADPVGEDILVVTHPVRRDGDDLAFGQVAVFVGRRHVISVARDGAGDHSGLRADLEKLPAMFDAGVDYILHGLLNAAAASFMRVADMLDDEVDALEATIPEGSLDLRRIRHLLSIRRRVKRMERALKPLEEVARKLTGGDFPLIRPDLVFYFRDIVDHIQRTQVICAGIQDGLASVFEYSALVEQQRTGDVTRQLAAWGAILAVPTAIAGIYGMNFDFMPELRWRYGYFLCMAIMIATSLVLFWRFRRVGWL